MKTRRFLALMLVACAMVTIFCGCDVSEIGQPKHSNCKIITVSDAYVALNPKCPKCGHLNHAGQFQISEGESASSHEVCESCGELYVVSVNR